MKHKISEIGAQMLEYQEQLAVNTNTSLSRAPSSAM